MVWSARGILGLWICLLWSASLWAAKPPARKGLPKDFVPPKLLKFVKAVYPKVALKERKAAKVILEMVVDKTGKVVRAKVIKSAGEAFDKAAIAAVKQFTYRPATYKKKPVPVRIRYLYYFFPKVTKKLVTKPAPRKADDDFPVIDPKTGKTVSQRTPPPVRRRKAPVPRPVRRLPPPRKLKRGKGAQLRGYVLERGTRNPIEGATVFLLGRGGKKMAVSNERGLFTLKSLRPGRYRLVIPVPNFKKFRILVTIKRGGRLRDTKKRRTLRADEERTLSFYLERVGSGLFETVTRVRKERKEVNRTSLRLEEIMIAPGTQGDPLKVIQNLPGVARTPLSTSFFIVRGSAPGDSRTYLDGHQIPALYHFGGLTAVVNGDLARRLDFIPGGFSVAYGRAMGGVISLLTRSGSKEFHGYLDLDLIDVGFLLEGPLNKEKTATFIVSARRSHIDAVLGLVLPEVPNFDLTVAPRYYDFQVKFDWKSTSKHVFSVMLYGSDDLLTFVREQPLGRSNIRGDFGFRQSFYRGNFTYNWRPSKQLDNMFTLHYGISNTDTNAGEQIQFVVFSHVISARDELSWKPTKWFQLRTGFDLRATHTQIRFRIPVTDSNRPGNSGGSDRITGFEELDNGSWSIEPAYYLEGNFKLFETLRLILGGRVDYFSASKEITFDPRLNVTWNPIKPLTLKGGVGLFSQPPTGQNLSEQFGNPKLNAQRAIHYTLGGDMQWTPYFNTSVTFYYKDFQNLYISSDREVIRDGKIVPERLRDDGSGRAYGVEFMLRHKPFRRFFGWISYTLGRSERRPNLNSDEYVLFDFDQTHIMTVVAAYKPLPQLTVSLRFRLVSGNPTTPRQGGIYDADEQSYFPIPGKTNSERNPFFHQLDLRVDYAFVFNTWKLMLYLDLQNVYNQANQEGVIYNYDSTQSAPLTGIPFFPSFGIKGQF